MPDPIKDLYQSLQQSGLFVDEADFRAQLKAAPKDVYSLVEQDGLFVDYSDFETALSLKKKEPSSPTASIGAKVGSLAGQVAPAAGGSPISPSTSTSPSGLPLFGARKAQPTDKIGQQVAKTEEKRKAESFADVESVFREAIDAQSAVAPENQVSIPMGTASSQEWQSEMRARNEANLQLAHQKKEALLKQKEAVLYAPIKELIDSGKYKNFFDAAGNFKTGEAIQYFDKVVREKGGGSLVRERMVSTLRKEGDRLMDAQTKQDIRKEGDKALKRAGGQAGLLGKSVASGWYKGLSDIGNRLASKGIDNAVSRYLQSKDYEAQQLAPGQYEWNGKEWFDRATTAGGQSLGASLPTLIPSAIATIGTGGAAGTALGTAIGFMGETNQIAGGVYDQVLQQTGDPALASQKADDVERQLAITLPAYVFSSAATLRLFKPGSIAGKLSGAAMEFGQEYPTEIVQGWTEAKATQDYQGSLADYERENRKDTGLDVLVSTAGQSTGFATAGKIYQSLATKTPSAKTQQYADMIVKQGVDFAGQVIDQQVKAGVLTEEEAQVEAEEIQRVSEQVEALKPLGVQGEDAKAYIALSDELQGLQAQMGETEDPTVLSALKIKAEEVEADLRALVGGQGAYVKVTYPGGARQTAVLPIPHFRRLQRDGEADALIQSAEAVEVVGDEKLNEELQQQKGEIGNAEGAPEGFYENAHVSPQSPSSAPMVNGAAQRGEMQGEVTVDESDLYKRKKAVETNGEKYDLAQLMHSEENVFIIEQDGAEIGRATLSRDGDYLENIRINPEHRRKGLAMKLYDFIEESTGKKLQPSPIKQSTEAKKLWEKRNLQEKVSRKANAPQLAGLLSNALNTTLKEYKDKAAELKGLEDKFFAEKGITAEEYEALPDNEKAVVKEEAQQWLKNQGDVSPQSPSPTPTLVESERGKTQPQTLKVYRAGKKKGDVTFYSKTEAYAHEYNDFFLNGEAEVTAEDIAFENPMVVELSDEEFTDINAQKPHITRAKKAGHDVVIFKNADPEGGYAGEEFYAVIKSNQGKKAESPISPSKKESERGALEKGETQGTNAPKIVKYEDAIQAEHSVSLEDLPEGVDEHSRQARSQIIREREQTPPQFQTHEIGTYAVDRFGEAYQLQSIPVDQLITKEEGTQRSETVDKYAAWQQQTGNILPIQGVENYAVHGGKVVVTDGNHRVLAAKKNGQKEIPVWVALTDPDNHARPLMEKDIQRHQSKQSPTTNADPQGRGETPATISENSSVFPSKKETFREAILTALESANGSEFSEVISDIALQDSDRKTAVKNIRKGKSTVATKKVEEAIEKMWADGYVYLNRGRGDHAESFQMPIEGFLSRLTQNDEAFQDLSRQAQNLQASLDALGEDLFTEAEEIITEVNNESPQSNELKTPSTPSQDTNTPEATATGSNEETGTPGGPPPTDAGTIGSDGPRLEDLSGIKKALVPEAVRDQVDFARLTDTEMMARGRELIDSGAVKPRELINRIVTDGRGVLTPEEVVALIVHKADMDNALRAAYKKKNEALEKGEEFRGAADIQDLELQLYNYQAMSLITANNQSLAFRLRQQLLDSGYNALTQIERYKAANNGYIDPATEAFFKEKAEAYQRTRNAIMEAGEKIEQQEGQEAIQNIQEDLVRKGEMSEEEVERRVQEGVQREIDKLYQALDPEKKSLADKALAALDKIQKNLRSKNYSDPTLTVAFIDAGITTIKNAIKAGVAVAKAVEMGVEQIKKAMGGTWAKAEEFRRDMLDAFQTEGVDTNVKPEPVARRNKKGELIIPPAIIRGFVKSGETTIEGLTEKVLEVVKDSVPDATARQVRDAITGYGREVNPTKDDLTTKLNQMRRVGKLISELEDLQAGIAREKNPAKKAKRTAQEEELLRQIRALNPEVGAVVDAAAKARREEERKLQAAMDAAQQSLNEYERRIRELDFSPKEKKQSPTSPELEDLRKKRDEKRKEYEELKKQQGPKKTDAQRLSEAKTRLKTRIKDLETRLKKGEYTKKKPQPVKADDEYRTLLKKADQLGDEIEKKQYEAKLKNRTNGEKIEDWSKELLNAAVRGLTAAGDLSFMLIQGGKRWFTAPIQSIRATGKAFQAYGREKWVRDFESTIKTDPLYADMKRDGVAFQFMDGKHASREDVVISADALNKLIDWALSMIDRGVSLATIGKVSREQSHKVTKFLNIWKNTAWMFNAYMNSLRYQAYREGHKYLTNKKGVTPETAPKDFKKMADNLNTLSSRASMGKMETSAEWLNILMFSARKVVSELKLFTPYVFVYYARMPKYIRLRAATEFVQGVSTLIAVNAAVWAMRTDWDDEDEPDQFWNPLSSNFLSHKVGTTYVDLTGGLRTMLVFQARLFSGKYTDSKGKTEKLGERFGKPINTRWNLITEFSANKFAPTFSAAKRWADQRKGQEIDWSEEGKQLSTFLWTQDLDEIYNDHPGATATFLTGMAVMGAAIRADEERAVTAPETIKHNEKDVKLPANVRAKMTELLTNMQAEKKTALEALPEYQSEDLEGKWHLEETVRRRVKNKVEDDIKKANKQLFPKPTSADKRKKLKEDRELEKVMKKLGLEEKQPS